VRVISALLFYLIPALLFITHSITSIDLCAQILRLLLQPLPLSTSNLLASETIPFYGAKQKQFYEVVVVLKKLNRNLRIRKLLSILQVSISSTFFAQLLRVWSSKAKKNSEAVNLFTLLGTTRKSCT